MYGAKAGRGREDDHICQRYCLLVCIETDEFGVFSYAYAIFYGNAVVILRTNGLETVVEPVPEGIRHGNELHVLVGEQSLTRRSCSAAATSDKRNFYRVVHGIEISRL